MHWGAQFEDGGYWWLYEPINPDALNQFEAHFKGPRISRLYLRMQSPDAYSYVREYETDSAR